MKNRVRNTLVMDHDPDQFVVAIKPQDRAKILKVLLEAPEDQNVAVTFNCDPAPVRMSSADRTFLRHCGISAEGF
jgi:hypothetical protein